MSIPTTFPELLARRLQTDPGQPLVTAYDDATGERTELSVTTYANWVSKTANLLTDELGLDAGDTLFIDLPAHWLVPVFIGAAWTAGIAVTDDPDGGHDLVICGPDSLNRHRSDEQVVACSLLPFAVRFAQPLPTGVQDFGLLWPGQSDVFVSVVPPGPDTVAWSSAPGARTQSDLLESAAALSHPMAVRLLTDAHPATGCGVPAFLGPMVRDGSLVLVRNASAGQWSAHQLSERATGVWRTAEEA